MKLLNFKSVVKTYCVTQAERALVCARQIVGQHCNVRERAKANKNQSSASTEIKSTPVETG